MKPPRRMDATSGSGAGLVIWIAGTPRPQPRPRFVGRGVVSTTGRARVWKALVSAAGREAVSNLGGPQAVAALLAGKADLLTVELEFVMRRQAADVDNLAKLVLDALMQVKALAGDDRRVGALITSKRKPRPGEAEGCWAKVAPSMPLADGARSQNEAAGEGAPDWLASA